MQQMQTFKCKQMQHPLMQHSIIQHPLMQQMKCNQRATIRKTNIWHSQYNQTIIINFLEMHMI